MANIASNQQEDLKENNVCLERGDKVTMNDKVTMTNKRCKQKYLNLQSFSGQNLDKPVIVPKNFLKRQAKHLSQKATMTTKICEDDGMNSTADSNPSFPISEDVSQASEEASISSPRPYKLESSLAASVVTPSTKTYETFCTFQSFHDDSFTDYTSNPNDDSIRHSHAHSNHQSVSNYLLSKEDELETNLMQEFLKDQSRDPNHSSPWGQPHQKIRFPLKLSSSSSKEVVDLSKNESKEGQFYEVEDDNAPSNGCDQTCCPLPMLCCPSHIEYQVFPVIPVYPVYPVHIMNAVPALSVGQCDAAQPGHGPTGVHVVSFPPVNFTSANMNFPVAPHDKRGLCECVTRKRGNNVTAQAAPPEKLFGLRPKSITCYICGRKYGTASIEIHEKQCLEKWRREYGYVKPEPVKPHVSQAEDEQVLKKEGEHREIDEFPGTGKSDYHVASLEESAYVHHDPTKFVKCLKCGRSFFPERLEVHTKSCQGFHKIV